MRNMLKASGILGVLSIAASLVGCGADVGAEGEAAEIGSTEQAVTLAATLNNSVLGVSSCKLHDATANVDYVVSAGGYKTAGTPGAVATIDAINTTNDTMVLRAAAGDPLFNKNLATARAFTKVIEDSANNACWFMGGTTALDNGAAALTAVDKVTVSNGVWSVSQPYSLGTARNDFSIEPCGTSKYLIIAGRSGGTYRNSLEVFDPSAGFSAVTPTLSEARSAIQSAALDSNHLKLIVSGGEKSGGVSTNIDTIVVSASTCNANQITIARLKDHANTANNLAAPARQNGVAFPISTAPDKFALAAGFDGVGLISAVDSLEITDWSVPKGRFNTALANIPTTTASPVLVYNGTTPYLIGGMDDPLFSAASASVSKVQFYSAGWTSVAAGTALLTPRAMPGATYVSSASKFYVSGGRDIGAPATLNSIEKF